MLVLTGPTLLVQASMPHSRSPPAGATKPSTAECGSSPTSSPQWRTTIHIWREYANGSPIGKVGLEFEFGKLRARLNETLKPDRCMLQVEGKPYLEIFSVNYGMVDYVGRTSHRENTERLPNPIRYAYLKDTCYAPERELR